MNKRKILFFIPLLITVAIAIVPIICFAGTGWWPTNHSMGLGVSFWVIYGLGILTTIIWTIVNFAKKDQEYGIAYLHVVSVIFLQFLAPITLLFAISNNIEWIFVFPVVIATLCYIAFIIVIVASSAVEPQMKATLEKCKCEEKEIVKPEETFNNDDGSFKGSRVPPRKK